MPEFMRNVFGFVGALISAAGLVMVIVAFVVGLGDLGAMLPPGIFMIVFGLIFMRVGARLGRVVMTGSSLDDGVDGMATVLEMSETGMTVNEQPVFGYKLAIESNAVPAFETTVKQVTPRMLAGAVLPGSRLGVKIDPESQEVAIDWSVPPELVGRAPAQPGEPGGLPVQAAEAVTGAGFNASGNLVSAEELLEKGRRGRATLRSVTDIGEIGDLGLDRGDLELADDRLYVITMDVKLPGREPYEVQTGQRVPDHLIGKVAPGMEVDVAVDRNDEQRSVAIDWDSLP